MAVDARSVALRACEAQGRELKRRLRATWTEPMADVQRALVRCRRRATELCATRAYLRGRRHLRAPLREGAFPGMEWDSERWHRAVAERIARDFPLPVEVAS